LAEHISGYAIGPRPTNQMSVYEYVDNPESQSNTTNGLVQTFNVGVYDNYISGNMLGQDNQLCVDLSTWTFGSIVCMQAISFLDPNSQAILGQIYYSGYFPAFVEEGYVLLAIAGGTGSYTGAEGELINGQNAGGYSFQYHLWYSLPPPSNPSLVPYINVVPPVPNLNLTTPIMTSTSTPPTPPTPPPPTPSTSSPVPQIVVSTANDPVAIAAIVIAVIAFTLLLSIIAWYFVGGFKQVTSTPEVRARSTTAGDQTNRVVTLESPREGED